MARRGKGVSVQVEGVERLLARLRKQENQLGRRGARRGGISGIVAFAQNYAIPVHERTGVHHPVGQAKFLEKPARALRGELTRIIRQALLFGIDLPRAILMACLKLQREAQLLTPVDTGALRASAYSRLEG